MFFVSFGFREFEAFFFVLCVHSEGTFGWGDM